jgi:hypothetical protein
MGLIARLDLVVRPWHIAAANFAAISWFAGVTVFGRSTLPSVALLRCPMGFCAGGYPPEELFSLLDEVGEEGRRFLHDSMVWGDIVLPLLFLVALVLDILWFSRPGARMSVSLQPMARLGLLLVPVLYFCADYLENAALEQMLRAYPDLEDAMAERASILTAAKSQLFAASAGIALALAIAAWGISLKSRAEQRPETER